MIPQAAHRHGTAVLLGETGVLIRGASGAGKTSLALALIAEARRTGSRFARLVADDVVMIEVRSRRLIARPHSAIVGKVERRGLGVLDVAHAPACVVRAVIDIAEASQAGPDRMPLAEALSTSIDGVELPRLLLPMRTTLYDRIGSVFDFLATFRAGS